MDFGRMLNGCYTKIISDVSQVKQQYFRLSESSFTFVNDLRHYDPFTLNIFNFNQYHLL